MGRPLYFAAVVSIVFFFFFSSPNLSGRRLDVYQFNTWCGLSTNLECRSEMCCTRLTGNKGRKNSPKNRHLHTITQICQRISPQLRHASTRGEKLVKQQYLFHIFSQYGELWTTNGWDRLVSLGHPSKFQRVSLDGCWMQQHAGWLNWSSSSNCCCIYIEQQDVITCKQRTFTIIDAEQGGQSLSDI